VRRSESKTVIGSVQPAAGGPPPSAAVPPRVMPAASRVLAEAGVPEQGVQGTGPGGRVTKQDAISATVAQQSAATAAPSPVPRATAEVRVSLPAMSGNRQERPVVMSPIRRRIAERLVEAQHEAALLTTFNEVDMSAVMALRARYKDSFLKKHGVKLGFMSFFVKAAVEALREIPQVNAEFREPHIVYRDYCDIGIAVGGGKGLVVPVIRNAEMLGFADIESTIADFAVRAADNKIKLEELQGGTFTISNGGVYGSLLSTPIINPPQSGILGLHAIQDRPVAHEGQVVIRPMMYIALSYDHRLVDGREAVTFLKRIKETMEDPSRLLLEV
jgi:2-oxoglutarate dehydrogenase E2 component (dihydrolipoamide succinyltransferase)